MIRHEQIKRTVVRLVNFDKRKGMSIHTLRQGNSGGKGSGEQPEPASKRQILVYMRLEPYEGKLSRMVLRREGAEQSALTQPAFAGLASQPQASREPTGFSNKSNEKRTRLV
jgi:hypothetical protein